MMVVSAYGARWKYIFAVCSCDDGDTHCEVVVYLSAGSPCVNDTDPQFFDFNKTHF